MPEASRYYIANRKRRHKKRDRGRTIVLISFLLLPIIFFHFRLAPLFLSFAMATAEGTVEAVLNTAIRREMSNSPAHYSDIVTLAYKADGSVASLSTDTARLLAIRTEICRAILSSLSQIDGEVTEIPVSSILGINLFPSSLSIPVKLRLLRRMNAYFISEFTESGINQTRHSIVFCVTVNFDVLIPSRTQTVTVERRIPLTETIIVGNVPDAYTKIDRLTDDITEEEIDDIYDFGADAD